MTYEDAIKYLYGLQLFGAKFGLENTRRLAELSGSPHEKLRFIHVAGTNGKGSVCAMLESIYRASGLRVGLFTSPHLISFRERIQIDRELISTAEVVAEVQYIQKLLRTFSDEAHPTFFEVVTIMALRYFAAKRCDLVIWETGLGGHLDATNIVTPLASVITNVQLDHEKWLGRSVEEIAFEKAGIIKPGIPILTCTDEPALSVITTVARTNNSPLSVITEPLHEFEVALAGDHQRLNAALAVATVRSLEKRLPVANDALRYGLKTVSWPGRLQRIERNKQIILLDGAHNPAGARALQDAVEKDFPNATRTLVLGVMRDKDCAGICNILAPLANRIITCAVSSERSADPDQLASFCRIANPDAQVFAASSLEFALDSAVNDRLLIITGSLHFIGHALQLLTGSDCGDERALNEWTGIKVDAAGKTD
jgi:dihydrofolate synthase/folylpolyglutamate synthase